MLKFFKKNKILFVYLPLVVYWVVLLIATSLPAKEMPSLGGTDKLIHFAAYFVLGVLLNLTLLVQNKSRFMKENSHLLTLIIVCSYGAFDEIHQMFIPGRSAEFLDWIADAVGAAAAVMVLRYLLASEKKAENTGN